MEESDAPQSWKSWFRLHGPRLLVCARQWTRTQADAEDVVQDAFVRFWRRQRGLSGDPLPLLLTSIKRAAFDLARRHGRRETREAFASVDEPVFESSPVRDERRVQLEAAIARLPASQREVLVLKIWGGLTFEEIASQLAIPANTAASRHRYALEAIRHELTAPALHG
jgi:RNA polymerase sigma-70 factor (ECF subfamily)